MKQHSLVLPIIFLSLLSVTIGNFSALARTPLSRPAGLTLPNTNTPAQPVDPVVALVQHAGDALLIPLAARAPSAPLPSADTLSLRDDSGLLTVNVPANWRTIDSGNWRVGEENVGSFLTAATDLAAFAALQAAPGLFFGVREQPLDADSLAASFALEQARVAGRCTFVQHKPYQDPFHSGAYELYNHCNGLATHVYLVLVVAPHTHPQTILLRLNLPEPITLAAAQTILNSFQVHVDGNQ